jgi:hypothetical protein
MDKKILYKQNKVNLIRCQNEYKKIRAVENQPPLFLFVVRSLAEAPRHLSILAY